MAATMSVVRGTLRRLLPSSTTSSFSAALGPQPSLFTMALPRRPAAPSSTSHCSSHRLPTRPFHTLPALQGGLKSLNRKKSPAEKAAKGAAARGAGGRGGKKGHQHDKEDPKLAIFRRAVLSVRRVPAPLRMGRNRYLRHWTIHRAWNLLRRQQREARRTVLMRQWQSMRAACEELRLTSGPGSREEGYLYRVAMEKKGVYGHHGIPIEYTRPQTETPAREAWNHDWKR